MKALKFLIPIIVILAGMIGVLQFLKSKMDDQGPHSHEGATAAVVGSQLPEISLSPLNPPTGGPQTLTLTEFAKSKNATVVLLNFWATWCSACLTEMPSILKLQERYAAKGFVVALVTVDSKPDTAAPPFLKKLGIGFQTFADRDQALADLFDVHGIPYTAILKITPGSGPKFLYREVGERDWDAPEVHREMDGWLASQ